MAISTSTQVPKTSDPAIFQRQCKVLFEYVLGDPNVEELGTSGQAQSGIDLLGRRRDRTPPHRVGIQCKLAIKSERLKTGSNGVVAIEAARALAFEPALKELIIVTTASNDASIQREAAAFTDAQAHLGRDFTVQVWGWETLCRHIFQFEPVLAAFLPDAFPHMAHLLRGQEQLTEHITAISLSQSEVLSKNASTHALLVQVSEKLSRQAGADEAAYNSMLDKQIDQYRNMINCGRPLTALSLLSTLWDNLPSGIEGRIRFRIMANTAACHLRLGNEIEAATRYFSAYDFSPEEPKAIALKTLAYLLLGEPNPAWAFGSSRVTGDPRDAQLVAYLILAATRAQPPIDPQELITASVANDPQVLLAQIEYVRTRGNPNSWWGLASDGIRSHPGDDALARVAAEAILDEAAQWTAEMNYRPLAPVLHERLTGATLTFERLFRAAAESDAWESDATSLTANLSTALRLLRRHGEARETLCTAIARAPNDDTLKHELVKVGLETRQDQSSRLALSQLPASRETMLARLQIAADCSEWASISDGFSENELALLNDDDLALAESLFLLARWKLGRVHDVKSEALALLERHATTATAAIVLYQVAAEASDESWAHELFELAYSLRCQSGAAARAMLARISEREGDFDKVIELLADQTCLTEDSDELRLLSRAYVNAPIRQAAIHFVESIEPSLLANAHFSRVAGSLYYNYGDLPNSTRYFTLALERDPKNAAVHLGLLNAWLRQDKLELMRSHLAKLEIQKLEGPAVSKMAIAQILAEAGEPSKAMRLAYAVACRNRSEQRVVMLYIGLLLPDPIGDRIPAVGDTITTDCWVRAERAGGRAFSFVIEDRLGFDVDHFDAAHPFSKLFLGKRPGDTVVASSDIGSPETWRVVEFKHKYLALLHEFLETLPTRFPNAEGLRRFDTADDDLSQLFTEVRKLGERDNEIFGFYTNDGFPLWLAASLRGRSSIDFVASILSRGEFVRTCFGTVAERELAVEQVQQAKRSGIVLDSYSAWVVHELNLFPLLRRIFPRVTVARSTIDELQDWRRHYEAHRDEGIETIGYANGGFFREEIPAAKVRESISLITNGIHCIEEWCEVLPSAPPSNPGALEKTLADFSRSGFLDPVYLSQTFDFLLVTEDLHFRTMAKASHSVEGAWVQAVLLVACEEGEIQLSEYAKAVHGLAARKHSHITLSSAVLVQMVRDDSGNGLLMLRTAVAFLGNETADYGSHLSVAWRAIVDLWRTDEPHLVKANATGIILDRVVKMFARTGPVDDQYSQLLREAKSDRAIFDYLTSWARGHFICH